MTEQEPKTARLEREGSDGIAVRQLYLEDAPNYFGLIDEDRPHMSQTHNDIYDETSDNYQTIEQVVDSILTPKPNKFRFGIWDGDKMVGSNNIQLLGGGRGEIGSWIGGRHTGHNYAARARKLLIEIAFEDLDLYEVVSKILEDNMASRTSVERSGLTYAGVDGAYCVYEMKRPADE
jgi:RimJ/RimL family protein N-acetyltransferase